ncbi:MAG: PIN domain-containing protein [Candidatus Hodarchaeales archaeon]
MVVVDTEFIFALRKNDRHHDKAKRILLTGKKQIIVTPSIFETMFVLLSNGKTENEIIDFLETISEIIERYGLEFVDFEINQLIEGMRIKRDHRKGGLFDSLIAGAAKVVDGEILANDKSLEGIHGLTRISFDDFLNKLQND